MKQDIVLAENLELWPIDNLKPYERNARTHSVEQIEKIAASILEFGFVNPILVDGQEGIVAGHGRLAAAKKLQLETIPVIVLDHLTEEQRRAYIIADNRLAELAGWDHDVLEAEIAALKDDDFDVALTGFSDAELEAVLNDLPEIGEPGAPAQPSQPQAPGSAEPGSPSDGPAVAGENPAPRKLTDDFIVPPFSVLDARQGYWKARKDQWLRLGIKSELGRGENLLGMSDTILEPDPEKRAQKRISPEGRPLWDGQSGSKSNAINLRMGAEEGSQATGTSIFDPVLCELAYRWFAPKGGTVVDPFAGGSVRGIVASKLGLQYIGIDLRAEQVEANRDQARELCEDPHPIWHPGDSRTIRRLCNGVKADLIFTCPPYANLEVYSDDPLDLSTLEYRDFLDAYREIISESLKLLKPDRFACIVVGEVREKDRNGFYNSFVPDTIDAFEDAGARFYNEMILLTSAGTLALRAGRVFSASRKIGKTHQNVLVFCKGDPWKAVEACGEIEVKLPPELEVKPEAENVDENETPSMEEEE